MMKRRICAIVLSIMTAISMTPMMAFADGVAAPMEGNASATMEDVSETYVYPRYEQITLMQNEVIDLSSFVVFGNQVPANAISVTVSDEAIAFYSNNKLAGMSEGATMMTVSYGDTLFSVPVVVVAETSEPTSIVLDQTALVMAVGDQTHLKLSMTPENAAMGDITWSSSDSGVVTVDEGVLRAVGKGTAEITASYGDLSAVCMVTVNRTPIRAIITDDKIELPVGQEYAIKYTEEPVENDETDPVSFVSDDPSIATVTEEGVVTGLDAGTTTITLTKGNVTKQVVVTVTRPLQGISIESDTNQIYKNETCQLKVIYDPTDTTDSKIVNWYCDAPDVARVDENGKVTALKKGIVEITAQVGQFHASCSIICLERPITEFTLNKTELSLKQGETTKLQATYYPDNTTDDTNILWQSSDENVVAVDEEGKVFAVGSGEADITATVNGHNATCKAVVDSEWIWPDVVHSGSCGQTVWWALDSQGVLYIYGFGNMVSKKHEWAGEPTPPWNYGSTSYISSIRRAIIFEGVTSISQNAFSGCGKLVSVFIPSTVTTIEKHAFWSCGLRDVTIPDSVVSIDSWAFNSLKVVRYYGTKEEWDKISIGSGNDTFNTALFRYNCIKAPLLFALADAEYEYDGNAKTPTLNITDSYGNMLVEGEDYELIYQNNVNAGQACILVKGKGIYQGEESIPFNIDSALINKCTIRDIPSVVYNGTSQTPACEVEFQGRELVEGLDYRVVYLNNTDAGTATVKVSGINNFNGTVTKTFVIEPKEISPIIDLSSSEYIYNGLALRPKVIVKDGELVLGDDSYEVHMPADSTTAGTKLVSVSLKGNYKGEAATTYIIKRADISEGAEILVEDAEYCGEPVTGNVRVIYNNQTLEEGLDYSIEYNNNTEAGTATVVICGMANYAGTVAKNFEIKPAPLAEDMFQLIESIEYTGEAIEDVVISAECNGNILASGVDYQLRCFDNINAGTATAIITGLGNYSGEVELAFVIRQRIATPEIVLSEKEYIMDGQPHYPNVEVRVNGEVLTDADYDLVMPEQATNAGLYTCEVTLQGNYSGQGVAEYRILPHESKFVFVAAKDSTIEEEGNIEYCYCTHCGKYFTSDNEHEEITYEETRIPKKTDIQDIELQIAPCSYNGLNQCPRVEGVLRGKSLECGSDFDVEYIDNIDAGEATIIVYGIGKYAGTKTVSFTIEPADINDAEFTELSKETYSGQALTPSFTAVYNGVKYPSTTTDQFDVVYGDNVNAGTASIKITGKGNFTGTKILNFTIEPKAITPKITMSSSKLAYNGKNRSPSVYVYDGDKKLTKYNAATGEGDYRITMADSHKNAGKYSILVTLCGNYAGGGETSFEITPKVITPTLKVSSTELTYNGKDRSPSVYVYDGSTKLTKYNAATGEGDYKISMAKSHKNVGKWTITVTMCGNYAGSAKTTFNIIPKGTSLKKVTSTKAKTFTVTWNKQTEKMSTKQITGYQIQWSTSSTFAKDNHTKKVPGVNSASKTITSKDWSGIKGGKTYYVRIRTYTTTSSGTYYSSWSTKSLKVKTK